MSRGLADSQEPTVGIRISPAKPWRPPEAAQTRLQETGPLLGLTAFLHL